MRLRFARFSALALIFTVLSAMAWVTPVVAITLPVTTITVAESSSVTPPSGPNSLIPIAPLTSVRTQDTAAHFEFSSEPGATFECKLDLGVYTTTGCDSGTGKDYPGPLASGSHTFYVRATSSSFVVGNPATLSWTVDTTPPQTTITGGPTAVTTATAASITFSASEGSTGYPTTFWCAFDREYKTSAGGPPLFAGADPFDVLTLADPIQGPCTTVVSYLSGKWQGSGLADGTHTLEVAAVDAVGNADPTPAVRKWAVDTTYPVVEIPVGPSIIPYVAGQRVPSTSAEFEFAETADSVEDPWSLLHTWTPPVVTNPVTIRCSLDGAAFTVCTSPKTYTGLAQTSHTFRVQATDAVGLTSTSSAATTRTWTVDTLPPNTIIDTAGPVGTTNLSTATIPFHSSETGSTFECRMDFDPFVACTSPFVTGPLPDGTHTFDVQATDSSFLPDLTPAERVWTIDTTAPGTFIYGGPAPVTTDALTVFTFGSDEPGSTFRCALDTVPAVWSACTSPKTYTVGAGDHTFLVAAVDAIGNFDESPDWRTWTCLGCDTTPPNTIIDTGPPVTTQATTATFTFHADEPATFQCKLDTAAFAACTSPQTYAGPLAIGSHTFQVKATDTALNTDATPASSTWTVGKAATSLTIKAPATARKGTRITVSGVLSSTEDPTCAVGKVSLKYGTSTLGPKATSSTGAVSFSVYFSGNVGVKLTSVATATCAASSSERLIITRV
jgi:hypothetical protein